MNTNLVQSLSVFDSINTPSCFYDSIGMSFQMPSNLKFNKTYYKYENGKLVAFRILAYAVVGHVSSTFIGLSFLVQLPNQQPKWVERFLTNDTKVFDSKEMFIAYQSNSKYCVNLDWVGCSNIYPQLAYAAVIGLRGKVFNWSDSQSCVVRTYSPLFERFMVCEEGTFIYVPKARQCFNNTIEKYYLSAQDCVKDRLNGMKIVEFEEEPYSIKINVLPNTQKVHTLRFVEE